MSGNSENENKLVCTRDGETILASAALTLNWAGLLAKKMSAPKGPLQKAVQCLLNDLRSNPASHAVSSEETDYAKELNRLLGKIKNQRQPAPALWVPYLEALANWQAHQPAKPTTNEKQPSSVDVARDAAIKATTDRVKEKLAREAAKAETAKKDAADLAALSTSAAEDAKVRSERETELENLTKRIELYALGTSNISNNSQPKGLQVSSTDGISISFPRNIASSVPDGNDPAATVAPCVFCGKEHALGDSYSYTGKGGEEVRVFNVQLLWIPAMTADGLQVYSYLNGNKNNQPRKLPVITCSSCARIARELAKADGKLPQYLPNYEGALEPVMKAYLKIQDEKKTEKEDGRGARTALMAKFGDMANNKGQRRDSKTRHREPTE